MKSLFVMDPLEALHVEGDSTYVVMRECTDRGYASWWCTPDALFALNGQAAARAARVRTTADAPFFHCEAPEELPLSAFDVVWMRKDPPFHMGFIFTTYLLDMTPRSTLVVNDPFGLKVFNEKLWAMQFPELHPQTLLSNELTRLRAFVEACPGRAVLKPWDGNGGRGVVVTHGADRNLGSLLELLTAGGEYVIAQPFLEGVERGDKRILLFEGDPVGAMLRVPTERDYRGNMHVGARVETCELDERDLEICRVLGPELKKWGMLFVGIDVIDGHLTEINVTSPTGIREINRMYGKRLESDLVDRVERLLVKRREES